MAKANLYSAKGPVSKRGRIRKRKFTVVCDGRGQNRNSRRPAKVAYRLAK